MTATVKQVIGDYQSIGLQEHIDKLIAVKAPTVVINGWKKKLSDFQSGKFKVNGLARKFKIADTEVKAVSVTSDDAYIYWTEIDKSVTAKKVFTDIIKLELVNGETYYYESANNVIKKFYTGDNSNTLWRVIPKFSK